MKQTRTRKTEYQYLKRAKNLIKAASVFFDTSIDELEPMLIVQYIVGKRTQYTQATYRQYKAALLFYFEANQRHYKSDELQQAVEYLESVPQTDCAKTTNNTSQLRRKNFDASVLNKLIYAISKTTSQFSSITINWLLCGALTGLRPHEWKNAEIIEIEGKQYLRVRNGKATNGRSHGEYRHLDISLFSEKEMAMLKDFFRVVYLYRDHSDIGFEGLQDKCTQFLKNVNNNLAQGKLKKIGYNKSRGSGVYRTADPVPRRITLYSVRHFFSSAAKSDLLDRNEIAALMGHKTDKTATEHYGKKRYGRRGKFKVKPKSEEVAKVELKYKNSRVKTPQTIKVESPQITVPTASNITPKPRLR